MEIKKAKTADLESQRATAFLLGLVLVLSIIFVAFEYTSNDDTDYADDELLETLTKDVELMPVTRQQPNNMVALMPARPKRKPTATKINVVDNTVAAQQSAQLPEGTQRQDGEGYDTSSPSASASDEEQTQALSPVATDMKDNPLNFRIVEDLPQFPGGAVELMKWLTKNLRYPASAQQMKVQGKVVVQFIINKDGMVSSPKIVTSLNTACDREALRVVRMMPKWKPGVQNNKPCRTMVCIPIIFKL